MPDKKPEPKKKDWVEEILFILLILIFLSTLLARVAGFLSGFDVNSGTFAEYAHDHIFPVLKLFSFGVSVLSFIGILYSLSKLSVLNALIHQTYK